jgi:hypothetical protein
MAEFHFRKMEASQKKCNVTIQFLVGGLVIHFAGIFHLSFSVQNVFQFLWQRCSLKISLEISGPQKALP